MTDPSPGTLPYGELNAAYAERLRQSATEDGPVWMVNLMKYKEKAEYADGRETELSGREADDAYSPLEQLAALGAEIVFVADVEDQLLGEGTIWDRVAVVKYPSGRAFTELLEQDGYQDSHDHKAAGMAKTIVLGCQPMDIQGINDDRVPFDRVPHPPTDEDGEVVVVHVLQFKENRPRTPEDMVAYQEAAGAVARPHGVYIDAFFEVDDEIVGDGRTWHQVRFNHFPSKEAFMAVVMDPRRLEAQKDHREEAIKDTYTMILRPQLNRLAESTGLRI